MTSGDREFNFDGLVGPTHTHAGLSPGNLASEQHSRQISNPRQAALQGLAKMQYLRRRGLGQAVLPPHERPLLSALYRLGFRGSVAEVLGAAASNGGAWLRATCSASAMWTANAATIAPSSDTRDGRLHLTVANLAHMFHRSLEAPATERILQKIFAAPDLFAVHPALPSHLSLCDEGAANHSRLFTDTAAVHLFGWGRNPLAPGQRGPSQLPARQTQQASEAVVRLNQLKANADLLWQQSPEGIDAGAFHSDVLCVGHESFLLLHEQAFTHPQALLQTLADRLGPEFEYRLVTEQELSMVDAVASYPFNSQLLTLPSGGQLLLAPQQSFDNPAVRQLLEQLVAEENPIEEVQYLQLQGSMMNGGGPACLRLRVPLTAHQVNSIEPLVFLNESLETQLEHWIIRHYRDRLAVDDLADPQLYRETCTALDELTNILRLGSVYEFQV